MRKICLAVVMGTLVSLFIHAQDESGPDTANTSQQSAQEKVLQNYFPVEGLEQWQYSYDISDLKEGVYNLVVRGRDSAGNIREAEAIDIRIDPESDLPSAAVTWPTAGMRVSGDLNILGSAQDDDGLDFIEVRMGDSPYQRAKGRDYWSLKIPTDNLDDGEYSITVRATDINGVEGEEQTTSFFIDRSLPRIDLDSHENGSLVSGVIACSGRVFDLNGLNKVLYSLDGGDNFEKVNLKKSDEPGTRLFSFKIDTRKLEDGAKIIWMKSEDLQGSVGINASLLFIDNTSPEIEILYPDEDTMPNGMFPVIGRVTDQVGVESLSYTYRGEDPVEIPLNEEDPFWSIEADFRNRKQGDITFKVTDRAGNSGELPFKPALDAEGDKPVLQLHNPADQGSTGVNRLQGWMIDDDGPGSLRYRVDRGEETVIETNGAFDIPLPDMPAGQHTLSLIPVDTDGVEGNPVDLKYTLLPEKPEVTVTSFLTFDGEEETFTPGAVIDPSRISGIRGNVQFSSGKGSVSWTFPGDVTGEAALKQKEGEGLFTFSIDFPDPVPFGYVPMELKAVDDLGSETISRDVFWITNLSRNSGEHGFYLNSDSVELTPERSFTFRYTGYPVETLELVNGKEFIELSRDGDFVTLSPLSSGEVEEAYIMATSDRGSVFLTPKLPVKADMSPPGLSIDGDVSGGYRGSVTVEGVIRDDLGPVELFTITADGRQQQVPLGKQGDTDKFSTTIDVSALPSSGETVEFRARDSVGNETSLFRTFLPEPEEESSSVKITPLYPRKEETVFPARSGNGKMYLAAAVTGADEVESMTASIDGADAVQLSGFPVGEGSLPMPAPGSYTITVSASYGDSKSVSSSHKFSVAYPEAAPELKEIGGGPSGGSPFRQGMDVIYSPETGLKGRIDTLRTFGQTTLSVDDGEDEQLKLSRDEEGYSFTIPVRDLSPGRHDVSVKAVDQYGTVLEEQFFFFLLLPAENRHIEDEEGIYPVVDADESGLPRFLFHGRELETVGLDGTDNMFTPSFNGAIISLSASAPAHFDSALLTAVTVDGDEFQYGPFSVSSDVTPPVLRLEGPENGNHLRDSLVLAGSVSDDVGDPLVEISINGRAFSEMDTEAADPEAESEEKASDAQDVLAAVSLTGIDDGPLHIAVRASDGAGNSTVTERFYIKDTRPVHISQILPRPGEGVNGMTSLYLIVEDEWSRTYSGVFSINGEKITDLSGTVSLVVPVDLAPYTTLPESISVALLDTAGNSEEFIPSLQFDPEGDRPRVEIQIPEENSLVQEDTIFSGMVFDDDRVDRIEYRLDDGEFQSLPGANSFEIAIPLEQLSDNEHTIGVRAFDPGGVESETVTRTFRVSREEPRALMSTPGLGSTNRGVVTLSGTAADANGIDAVYISVDNGISFQKAVGTEEWSYPLDTSVLVDGNVMVLIRAEDSYGVEAVYTSLLTVDNTPPAVEFSSPMDGMSATETLMLQARITDDVSVKQILYSVAPMDRNTEEGEEVSLSGSIDVREVVLEALDISTLPAGRYTLTIHATDDAANESSVSRNIIKRSPDLKSVPRLLFPMSGTSLHGPFVIEGKIDGDMIPESVILRYNNRPFDVVTPDANGYFSRRITPDEVEQGKLTFEAVIDGSGSEGDLRSAIEVHYEPEGAWVTIDSVRTGDYVHDRPWIEGTAGYFSRQNGEEPPSREIAKGREVSRLEYSLDNGRSFQNFRAKESWKFRLETQDFADGEMGIIVRAYLRNGETAQTKVHVVLDDTLPRLTIIDPEEGMAFNDVLSLNGAAFDENGLTDVEVMLRKGSKRGYSVPEFIQGLYIDAHFLGATYWEAGIGLTFFNDNVKIQALVGNAPEGRFNGMVFGIKLLANVATIPYGFFFGPDLDWLSSSIAVGSVFEYFTMTQSSTEQTGLVLGALVAQIELIKMEFPGMKIFNTYSIYFEDQLWFISSDIQGGLENRMSFGFRINVF